MPDYPARAFETVLAARQWVGTFVNWYNLEHRHSAIRGGCQGSCRLK
ncbi:hypothetical protein [Polaromonas sp. CG9_12]|nr:hypothetical protein [Polaromonas sp. CG9_12]